MRVFGSEASEFQVRAGSFNLGNTQTTRQLAQSCQIELTAFESLLHLETRSAADVPLIPLPLLSNVQHHGAAVHVKAHVVGDLKRSRRVSRRAFIWQWLRWRSLLAVNSVYIGFIGFRV